MFTKVRVKQKLILFVLFFGVFFAACQPNVSPQHGATPTPLVAQLLQAPDHSRQNVTIQRQGKEAVTLDVEVVNTVESVQQGLSDRESIGSDGMLFVFPQSSRQSFWMPRMKFDIDIVWINNGEIIGITANVPRPPTVDSTDLPLYHSPGSANMVLELPSGKAAELELTAGDVLVMP